MRKTIGLLIVIILLILVWVDRGFLQLTSGFGVGPLIVRVNLQPGKISRGSFTIVTQNIEGVEKISLEVSDMLQLDGERLIPADVGKGIRSCARWIKMEKQVRVKPNSSLRVPFIIRCPPRASGEYFAFITVRVIPRGGEAKIAATIQPAVNVKVEAVVVNRPTKLGLEVGDLQIENSTSSEEGKVLLTVRSTGEIKTPLEGDILLSSAKNSFPLRIPIPHKRSGEPIVIYPGACIKISCSLPYSLPPGNYSAKVRGILLGNRKLYARFDFNIGERKNIIAKPLWKREFKINLQVRPEMVELILPPGAVRTVPIQILNREDKKVYVTAEVKRVRIEPNGLFTYANIEGEHSWVKLFRKNIVLDAHRFTILRAQIKAPKSGDVSPTQVCAVHLQAHLEEEMQHKNDISIGEYGVLIIAKYPKVPPANLQSSTLQLIRTSPEKNPSAALLRIKNTGGDIAKVSGEIILMKQNRQRLAGIAFGKVTKEIILPGAEREIRFTIPPLDKGEYLVLAKIDFAEGVEPFQLRESFVVETEIPEGLKKI